MAITLPALSKQPAISADLMYQFYDNKAITPQIREALKKRDEAEAAKEAGSGSSSESASKFGPAARVNITDQIIRMNIADKTTKFQKDEEGEKTGESSAKKPSRYDVLSEMKKLVSQRESAAKAEKDAKLQEIADKVAADEEAKKTTTEEE
jgi:hypothetical protein